MVTPDLELRGKERSELTKVLTDVILRNSKKMKKGDSANLGPEIKNQFPNWPSTPTLNMKPQPHLMENARQFGLAKISEDGCSVEPGASPPDIYYVTEEVKDAICALFDPTKEGVLNADEQLRLAKTKGAERTILLLDCHITWRPNIVKQVFAGKDSGSMSNIDVVYLVQVSRQRISKIWASDKRTKT